VFSGQQMSIFEGDLHQVSVTSHGPLDVEGVDAESVERMYATAKRMRVERIIFLSIFRIVLGVIFYYLIRMRLRILKLSTTTFVLTPVAFCRAYDDLLLEN
jgi:hypothetical protein